MSATARSPIANTERLSRNDERISLLGISVDPLNVAELTEVVCDVIRESKKVVIANHNMHSLYLFHHDQHFREFYRNAGYAHADGMWIVFLARLLRLPLKRKHRVTYADWFDVLMRRANDEGWRVFYLGSRAGVARRGMNLLRERYENLNMRVADGYFDVSPHSLENRRRVSSICAFRPHLLLVGMGMPRQERWVLDNLKELDANAILVCGAAMDYLAGEVRTPPRWTGRVGLEWLFRLWQEPKRLWRRYLIEPWFTIGILCKSFCHGFSAKVATEEGHER